MSEHNNAPAVPQGAPEINYPALIEAAFAKNRKWTQGTTGCIAFARGAEWFRDQMLAATPAPAPAAGILDRARWGGQVVNLMRLAEAADKAVASMTVPAPEAGSESKIVIDVGPGGSGGGPAEAAPPATEQTAPAPAPAQEIDKSVADAEIKAMYVESQGSDKGWLGIEGSYFIGGVVAARKQKAAPAPAQEPAINYHPGTWYEVKSREELEAFFLSRLPAIRKAAHEHGYAIGLHGSLHRDMDLIAVPWRDGASDKDKLTHAIAMAAVGMTRNGGYEWEAKPAGRVATSLPCCWTPWHGEAGSGHIDLSVMTPAPSSQPFAQRKPNDLHNT